MPDDEPMLVYGLTRMLESFKYLSWYAKHNQAEAQHTRIEHNGKVYGITAYLLLIRGQIDAIEASARVRC